MYRKIIFISLNLFQDLSLIGKTMILIFFSFSSFLLTFHERPFLLRKMNILELYSNLSASLTLVLGTIYISNENEFLNVLCFFFVALVNICFGYLWLTTIIKILIMTHEQKIKKYYPKLTACYNNYLRKFNLFRLFKNSKENIKIPKGKDNGAKIRFTTIQIPLKLH